MVADPIEGFHLFLGSKDGRSYPKHHTDISDFNQDEDTNIMPLGKIEKFALSSN